MATMVNQRIDGPTVTPAPFGLFSVVPPASPGDSHWQHGVQWESWNCVDVATTVDPCITGTTPAPKSFDRCPFVGQAEPVTVYVGIQHSGGDDRAVERAGSILTAAEETGVEEHLWSRFGSYLTPTAATDALHALVLVEGGLARHYRGRGVIHMNKGVATYLAQYLVRQGDQLQTMGGTPVVAGSGYNQEATDDTPGEVTIYGTGGLFLMRSDVLTIDSWDRSVNDHLALAERTYLVGWDCYITGRTATGL